MKAILIVLSLLTPVHDQWANNTPVPKWVKSYCCGPQDVHELDISQVHRVKGGWKIDGVDSLVTDERVFPSQDGEVWGFWTTYGPITTVHCLFIPWSG